MKNLADLVIHDGIGPRVRLSRHYCAGQIGYSGLDGFLSKTSRWRICDGELAERLWKVLLKRRAPRYVVEALVRWRCDLQHRANVCEKV